VKNKPPPPSFLGIQVQPKKQAPWASAHPKENGLKPPRQRQIRFADVMHTIPLFCLYFYLFTLQSHYWTFLFVCLFRWLRGLIMWILRYDVFPQDQ
jgi:hypothetical protein